MPKRNANKVKTLKDDKKRKKTQSERRFFGLKFRSDESHRARVNARTRSEAENPFVDLEKQLFPGHKRIEVDFSSLPAKYDHAEFMEILNKGAMEFPWFHEHEFEGSKTVKQALRLQVPTAIRRVLLAYMGGGTKDDIAARVPTSKSTIFKIIRGVIYSADGIDEWLELGLIRLWDLPELEFEGIRGRKITVNADEIPVVCLICHRVVSFVPVLLRKYDFSVLYELEIYYRGMDTNQEAQIKGHLIHHFPLSRRLLVPNRAKYSNYSGYESTIPGRRIALTWFKMVEQKALSIALNDDHLFTPNVVGREPSEMEVHKFYQELMNST